MGRYFGYKFPIYLLLILVPLVLSGVKIDLKMFILAFSVSGILTILEIFIRRHDIISRI